MAKFNEYPVKTTPKDADKFMLYSAEDAANKLIDYDKLADAVLNKLTSKTFGLDAGNVTTKDATDSAIGSSLRLTVKEKVAPVITVTNPTASATLVNNKPTITWTVTDDDSGVNPSTIGITIDSGSKITDGITKTAVTGGYNCSYIPATALTDGSHTIRFDAESERIEVIIWQNH